MKIIVKFLLLTLFNITVFSQSIEETAALAVCECVKNINTLTYEKYRDCLVKSLVEAIDNNPNIKFYHTVENMQIAYKKTDSIAKSICESTNNKNVIDRVYFSYSPFNHYPLKHLDFKFNNDTLFVYESHYNYKKEDFDYILCQKIFNPDTVKFIKEFIQLFILGQTENMIIREKESRLVTDYTHVRIQTQTNGIVLYDENIVMYPEREYHPKFLQLVDIFYGIAVEHTNREEKKE